MAATLPEADAAAGAGHAGGAMAQDAAAFAPGDTVQLSGLQSA
eukprot:CAMPEP_0195067248 /NCGR_PEP_ID=MMETSP0448-20130528/12368_1 /TAXON_ID=66468 /ORGANISM="Heterocapsa triquestra, Strain CCMP 448" /LENGTH=42 /DNA_ID= /DNA_START= /DNA_END= /DNA_ORIENTATION=